MSNLPEFVNFTIQANGKTYWAIPDIANEGCEGCSFTRESAKFCRDVSRSNALTHNGDEDAIYPCNAGQPNSKAHSIVFVHPRFVKSITAKLVTHRLEQAHKEY